MPLETRPVGWAALVSALGLQAPVRGPSCISAKHVRGSRRRHGIWSVFDKRYDPGETFVDQLVFALRHENLDLLILKRAFEVAEPSALEAYVRSAPTGATARRAWFFYEWLTDRTLDLADAPGVAAVDALDQQDYFTAPGTLSRRHRVRDNLLGTKTFCPIIRRTDALEDFIALGLAEKAGEQIGKTGAHLIARAASFMLLADSRASFAIEGERPQQSRLQRWGDAIVEAGKRSLDENEIHRLHAIVIGDDRFTKIGYRDDGVFLGERDHNHEPLPEFIGARADDLAEMMEGLFACNRRLATGEFDAVLQAAAIAFGFVFIHPLADGNGRLHRCLVHHVLAKRGFTPTGMVFPVSSVMLDRIDAYRSTLQLHTKPLMDFIEWRPTSDRNVDVTNDTADLYRYFDCTDAAEFLYGCVRRTVDEDLPREINYLRRHDEALERVMHTVEMPDRLAQNLIMFIRQNAGTLPSRRRTTEFSALSDDEVTALEAIVNESFAGFEAGSL